MENYRKFILIFLIIIFAALSVYFISAAIKTPDVAKIIISILFLFLFVIFNSILSASSNLYASLITHALISAILFGAFYYIIGLNITMSFIIAVIYLVFQICGYFRVFYFGKDRLKINWLDVFRSNWRYTSLFLVFAITFFVVIKFDANILNQENFSNIIKKTKPLFNTFNLPSVTSTIIELGQKQISKQELQQLQQLQKLDLNSSAMQELTKSSINNLNQQFNLNLTGSETIADAIVLYLKNIWNKLNDNMKLIIKMILAILLITTFQPIFWILGIILGMIALPIFKILEKINLYSKETEQVQKEKIVV